MPPAKRWAQTQEKRTLSTYSLNPFRLFVLISILLRDMDLFVQHLELKNKEGSNLFY